VRADLTAVDLTALDVIGYNLATPEPSTFLPLAALCGGWLVRRRRKRT
jgi:hypothetical protein